MIIVTNQIKVKKGMGAVMAPRFTAPSPLDTFDGFVKVEVLLTQNLTDYDELSVNMYWEDHESFSAWRNSDAFKAAHKQPEPGSEAAKKESPIISSQLLTYEVAAVREKAN
ncbi:MAG: heme oxygenase [Bacillus sp. (in: firmicutes)]